MSKLSVTIDGHTYELEVEVPAPHAQEMIVKINGETLSIKIPDADSAPDDLEWVMVNDRPYEIVFDRDLHWIKAYAGLHSMEVRDLDAAVSRPRSGDGRIKAPIPGLVTRILVNEGDHVQLGQAVVVLEAMKMENELRAQRAGTVTAIPVKQGQVVVRNEVLAEIS
jgi:biotin carboxyl carrier protein